MGLEEFPTVAHYHAIWYLNGVGFLSGALGPTLPSGWTLNGAADFNADGKPDYVLFNPSAKQTVIWYPEWCDLRRRRIWTDAAGRLQSRVSLSLDSGTAH